MLLSAIPILLTALLSTDDLRGTGETLLLQSPTVSATHVAFVFAEDLWVVSRDGGDARRLTSSPGSERTPRFSPDGEWIAFTGEYEGNTDVYVISVRGGTPRRLTWHPGSDFVRDWHPDGTQILFASRRASGAPVSKLFQVSVNGGMPIELPIPKVSHASYDSSGTRIAYTPIADAFRTWKRYRGGRVPPVWIYDCASHSVEQIPHTNASDTFPVFLGEYVYFGSDRSGTMNLHRYLPGSGKVEQLTNFSDYHIRSMSGGAGVIAFEQAGAIHLYDTSALTAKRLQIRVPDDGVYATPRWESVRGAIRDAAISPNGKRAVFEARGEIITMPREHGDARNLTRSPGAHERTPAWSNDGESIAYLSDESGEYQILVRDRLGRDEPKRFDLGGAGFYRDLAWSPDDDKVLFTDKANRIYYLTLATGDVTKVAEVTGSLGEVRPSATWSPDGLWIAYEARNPRTMYDHIALYEVATTRTTRLTDGFGAASDPAFSRDGKYLFFTASVNVATQLFGLDMRSSASRDANNSLYVAVLQKETPHPFGPRNDSAVASDDDDKKRDDKDKGDDAKKEKNSSDDDKSDADKEAVAKEGSDKDKKGAKKKQTFPAIELDDIDQRIVALPLSPSNYAGLACVKDALLYIKQDGSGTPELTKFDLTEREEKTLESGVRGFSVSADGKSLLLASGSGFSISNTSAKEAKKINIDGVKVRVEPDKEWPQILREVWRIQRDYFYDPNMHGVAWDQMWTRWEKMLPHVRHRADLTMVIQELIGELACGHQYISGGDYPDGPEGVSVGLLGADLKGVDGRYQIERIYRGQNWNTRLRAPLTAPGVDVSEGDFLIAVNGQPITSDENLYAAFENSASTTVTLTVSAKADGSESRDVDVEPIRDDSQLRRLSWIEENRQRVDQMSNGRLAYIYMPDTGSQGMAAFDRDFYSQLDRDGVVLDERYNGGGQVADYVIDVLSREVMSFWMNRELWPARSPFGMIDGPKVMVVNEYAGSGGDWMPWTFQNRKVGPLVGKRTWGGLVGISGYPPLMDGGNVTAASFGVMGRDGKWAVENVGVAPDYEVEEWPAEVIAGHDPQLEKAVALAMKELETYKRLPTPVYTPPTRR